MVNVNKLDLKFTQKAGCCLFSSYAIILNYFLENRMSVQEIFDDYTVGFPLRDELNLHRFVAGKYHSICRPMDIRGTEYICQLHKTMAAYSSACSIEALMAFRGSQPISIYSNILDSLTADNALALVVYMTPNGSHTVVLGCDDTGRFFVRNPNDLGCNYVDVKNEFSNGICELILFKGK